MSGAGLSTFDNRLPGRAGRLVLLRCGWAALLAVLVGCGAERPEGGGSGDADGRATPAPTERAGFMLFCGRCGEDPAGLDLFRSDFSAGFLGENESCAYAPANLVDGDPGTGWAEGAAGAGVGTRVVVPGPLGPHQRVRIWSGDGRSPEAFAAHARPKKLRATVLRLRAAEPRVHDATGCSYDAYVEPVAVAASDVEVRDVNGYQELSLPAFEVEHYEEYPREWLLMDGTDRHIHGQQVAAGEAEPFRRVPTPYAYFLELTLLDAYPGNREQHVVISEVGFEPAG